MPAPPSSRQTAAKNAAVANRNTGSTTQVRSGNGKMSSSSTQTGGVSRNSSPSSNTSARDDRQPSRGTSATPNNPSTSIRDAGRGISTPTASGSPGNNPVSVNPMGGNLRNAMIQRQAATPANGLSRMPSAQPLGMGGPRGVLTTPQARPDPRFNVGVIDAPRLAADPTNGIGQTPGYDPVDSVSKLQNYLLDVARVNKANQPKKTTPPTVARINPDGSLSLVKDQERLPGMPTGPAAQFDSRNPALNGAVTGEPAPSPYGADPFGTTNLVQNPQTTMPNAYPNIAGRLPKEITSRVPQEQPTVTAQNYGFQSPPVDPSLQRASIVNQWRGNQITNNYTKRGRGLGNLPSASTQTASVDPTSAAPGGGMFDTIKDYAKSGYDQFTEANKKINAVPGGAKTVTMLANMLQGNGKAPSPTGARDPGNRGLSQLPKTATAAPTPVQGPSPAQPGFTWVQWSPGSPPVQIPTNALIGAA